MALKGQKFCKYSNDIKNEVLDKIKSGMSISYLAKQYNIPRGTVCTWTDMKNHPEMTLKSLLECTDYSEMIKELN